MQCSALQMKKIIFWQTPFLYFKFEHDSEGPSSRIYSFSFAIVVIEVTKNVKVTCGLLFPNMLLTLCLLLCAKCTKDKPPYCWHWYLKSVERKLGPVSQKSRNVSGPFRVSQFPLYLCNAEILSYQSWQSSWFFLAQKISFSKQADCSLTTGFSSPKSSSEIKGPSLVLIKYHSWSDIALDYSYNSLYKTE